MEHDFHNIDNFIKKLKSLECIEFEEIKEYKFKEGKFKEGKEKDIDISMWSKFTTGSLEKKPKYFWIRRKITVSNRFNKKDLIYRIVSNSSKFLVHTDGNLIGAINRQMNEVVIKKNAKAGEKIIIALLVINGNENEDFYLKSEIVCKDSKINRFLIAFMGINNTLKYLNNDSQNKKYTEKILKEVVYKVNLNNPYSEAFYESLNNGLNHLNSKMKAKVTDSKPYINLLANFNEDSLKNDFIYKNYEDLSYKYLMDLDILNEFKNLKVIDFTTLETYKLKRFDSNIFKKFKEKVFKEQIQIGNYFDFASCSLNFWIYLLMFRAETIKEEFSIDFGNICVIESEFLPSSLPQILKNFGIKVIVVIGKCENILDIDNVFKWRGIDGSEIFVYLKNDINNSERLAPLQAILEEYSNNFRDNKINFKTVTIDPSLLKNEDLYILDNSYEICTIPNIRFMKWDDLFRKSVLNINKEKKIQTIWSDLYFAKTSFNYAATLIFSKSIKNAETLYKNLLTFESISKLLNCENTSKKVNSIAKKLLTLSEIQKNYFLSPQNYFKVAHEYNKTYNKGYKALYKNLEEILDKISTKDIAIVTFNLCSFKRDDIAEAIIPKDLRVTFVYDESRKYIPFSYDESYKSLKYKKIVFFAHNVESIGYKTYYLSTKNVNKNMRIIDEGKASYEDNISNQFYIDMSVNVIESKYYNIKFDSDFNLLSLYDKEGDRELIKEGEKGNSIYFFDKDENLYKELNNVKDVQTLDIGPVRICVKVVREVLNLKIEQLIYFYKDCKRIDFWTKVISNDLNKLQIKLPFNLNLSSIVTSSPIGYSEHTKNDVNFLKNKKIINDWVALKENNYDLCIFSNTNFKYDIKDSNFSIFIDTLNFENSFEFTYSIYPTNGAFNGAKKFEESFKILNPLIGLYKSFTFEEKALKDTNSFFKLDKENCVIEYIKKEGELNEFTLMIYENSNKEEAINLFTYFEVKDAYQCNFLKENKQKIDFNLNTISFKIKPFEIKILLIYF